MTTEESSKFAIDELDDSLSEDTEEDRLKLLEAEDVYHAIIQASDLIWTFEFREAEFLLAPFKDNISVLMQLAEIQAWKSSLDETDENHQLALDKMISLEAIAEATFNKYQPQSVAVQKISSFFRSFMKKDEAPPPPVDPEVLKINKRRQLEALSVLADTSGALAMLHLRKQGFVRAANYVRKAWKHYKDAENILLHDDHVKGDFLLTERGKNIASRVQFGYGLFNYVISMLPVALKWIVEAIGFQGDRDKAIADLESCSKLVPSPRSTWASILLVGMRWFFNDEEEEGLRLGHELLEKYPTSPLLKTTMANLYRRRADLEKSNLYFQQSIEAASAFPQFKLTAEYELGHNFFLSNRWHDAIPPIEEYLAKSFSKNFKAFGSYKLGICYWILSVEAEKEDPPNKERAQELRSKIDKLYREIPKHVRSNMSYDKYAEKRAALYFKQNGWSELDIFFVSIDNMLEIKKFDEATALLDQSIPLVKASHPENYAHWVYLKGLSLKKQHMYEKAKNYFQKVLSLRANITHDTWIIPYSAVELAEVFLAEKNIKMATTAIDVAKSFPSGYDFEKHCSMKIKKAAGKIAKLPSSPAAADSSSSSSSSSSAPAPAPAPAPST